MPIQCLIHREHGYVQTICTGIMTLEDILEYQDDIWVNGDVEGFDEVFNALEADFSGISLTELLRVSQNAIKINKDKKSSKLAFILMPGNQQKMAEFYRSTQDMITDSTREINIFYQLDDALNWIQNKASALID